LYGFGKGKPDGFGYLLEAALNLFGVREGRAAEWFILDWKPRCFSDDLGAVNGCGGI
jgi:hypothetical protein